MEILSMLELWVQINKAAITLFASLLNELSTLKEKLGNVSPLIITGVSLGGSVASLFTLWLLKDNNKHPTCFTFGSPLLGDSGLQQAISERPSWNSSFLHVVSNQDPIPRSLISPTNDFAGSIPQSCIYNPFGMFLLCSDSDCSFFEEPESVLDIMMEMNLSCQHQDNRFLLFDYKQVLERLKHRVIFKGASQLFYFSVDQLQAGIDLQLEAIGIGGQTSNMNPLRTKVKKRVEESFADKRKRNAIDPDKSLCLLGPGPLQSMNTRPAVKVRYSCKSCLRQKLQSTSPIRSKEREFFKLQEQQGT
ncbi:hypothetical protein KY290_014091 [Solanum tuberosum]|uniref:Fungal lipase-type domain-containing protein n=1 Tax=Solanum tuberosum TaxID=4113 RepID=A0ABQ7VNN7_SOLTU|nr:hypothetical protein KY289_014188 [Solanum tuberosum]KAH0717486.1 hypothetical protein KY285_013517 [Solanum tuberosum]KAH0770110.1 hypothetical protein KY290_014091 [Solanum tuberosum]